MISDIHANLEALRVLLAQLEASDELLCLGDIVGYGPDPNACLALLRERAVISVLGNHDVAAVDDFGTSSFNDNAREAIRWTQSVLDSEHREWLNGLSYELRMPEFLMVHGAPVRYFEYCNDIAAARRAFEATDAPLIFVGHTHIAEFYRLGVDGLIEQRHMQHGGDLLLEEDARYIVNVGSIGQPRDLNPLASFVFYEPELRRIAWRRFAYPIETVREKIAARALPIALGHRLEQGR